MTPRKITALALLDRASGALFWASIMVAGAIVLVPVCVVLAVVNLTEVDE
jgi:hypothetical protein